MRLTYARAALLTNHSPGKAPFFAQCIARARHCLKRVNIHLLTICPAMQAMQNGVVDYSVRYWVLRRHIHLDLSIKSIM